MRLNTHHIPGMTLTDHQFSVPLNYADPEGETLTIFAREVVAPQKEQEHLPWLVYFQGGPGYGSPRPLGSESWIKRALERYRVLLLDQRGTGRSTPLTFQTLARLDDPQAQADYLTHFRADAIVQDAEFMRRELLGEDEPWSALGQSYGGFCLVHYLSTAPHGLREVMITGGLPSLYHHPDAVYRATYQRVAEKNERYFERYPNDAELAREIANYLSENELRLPGGGLLTPRRFQQLGMKFGASDGFEQVHYLLEEAFVPGPNGWELSFTFLRHFEQAFSFETNPIYALLHESIYCQNVASNWSAERMRAEYPAFEFRPNQPLYFTGEMVYPWQFDDYKYLQPLKEAAEILAAKSDWPALYEEAALRDNTVPSASAIYYNDMYVERSFSEETAKTIKGMKVWVTSEYEHNGLRASGTKVFERLLDMLDGQVDG